MSQENPSTAFGPLETRAAALAGDDPLDRISLRNHVVTVEIGAFETERGVSQRISFDVVVEVGSNPDPVDDDVDRILSYDTLTQAIDDELAAERLNLLETLAERVARNILTEPQAQRVFVRIEKLDRGPGALGVEIVRSKDRALRDGEAETGQDLHPVVIQLSNAALQSARLPGWLDQLEGLDGPAIICVERSDDGIPISPSAVARRRIALLAMDQNAWRLAGRDDRLVVAGSRTELDWAIRNRKLAVWAPAKMALDAVGGEAEELRDDAKLAGWLAKSIHATRLICVDTDPPDGNGMTISTASATQDKLF